MLARVVKKDSPDVVVTSFFGSSRSAEPVVQPMAEILLPPANNFAPQQESISPAVMSASIEDVLQSAREEAAMILAQAEQQREAIEQVARESARQSVRAELEAELQSHVGDLREELTATLAELSGLRDEITSQAETQLVELAIEIAKKVVAREVMFDRDIAFTLVKVSLARLQTHSAARVHLHPEDFAYVQAHRERLNFHGALEIIEDRSITIGGCLIRTETGDMDARIESQFEEIAHGLLGN